MFWFCDELKKIGASSSFKVNVEAPEMFEYCYDLEGGSGTKYVIGGNNIGSEFAHIDGGSSNPGYFTRTGWKKQGNSWTYIKIDGKKTKGWKQVKHKWYYFNGSGIMQTGWKQINGNWFYFNTSGEMKTGWGKINNKWYYFNSAGHMQTSKWIGGTYYVKADGTMAISQWVDNGRYYVGADGKWVKKG